MSKRLPCFQNGSNSRKNVVILLQKRTVFLVIIHTVQIVQKNKKNKHRNLENYIRHLQWIQIIENT